MQEVVYVGIGGFLGAISRFFIAKMGNTIITNLHSGAFFAGFPLGTLLVNVTGSFLLGFINYSILNGKSIPSDFRSFSTIGFIGAYTTMSTFAYETFRTGEIGQVTLMCINIMLNIGLCILAIYLGKQVSLLLFK